jgi:hypothetical protein
MKMSAVEPLYTADAFEASMAAAPARFAMPLA